MENIIISTLILLSATAISFAQVNSCKSDLRMAVDSIILHEIGYIVDSTTDKIPTPVWNPAQHRGLPPAFSTAPLNPMPLILVNGILTKIEILNNYVLDNITNIQFYGKNNASAMAVYGTQAQNGLILIEIAQPSATPPARKFRLRKAGHP